MLQRVYSKLSESPKLIPNHKIHFDREIQAINF